MAEDVMLDSCYAGTIADMLETAAQCAVIMCHSDFVMVIWIYAAQTCLIAALWTIPIRVERSASKNSISLLPSQARTRAAQGRSFQAQKGKFRQNILLFFRLSKLLRICLL